MAAAASAHQRITIVDGGIKSDCDATEASIRELWALEAKINDCLENEEKLGEIAHSVADNCAQLAWVKACQDLEQARNEKSNLESCVNDNMYSQVVDWQAKAHYSSDKSAFEKKFKELFARLSCLQKVVLARLLGWGGTAIVGATIEITVRPEYLH
ncbi:MAG: hypothetical protein EBU46_16875 [Nitrosomonadaceae bacterium]|nr:hypothetical protein [Nitrosomonadaceae bacterium]